MDCGGKFSAFSVLNLRLACFRLVRDHCTCSRVHYSRVHSACGAARAGGRERAAPCLSAYPVHTAGAVCSATYLGCRMLGDTDRQRSVDLEDGRVFEVALSDSVVNALAPVDVELPTGWSTAREAKDDLLPAAELLPKLHLALKIAGSGNWPRLAVPLCLLPILGASFAAPVWIMHFHVLSPVVRDLMSGWAAIFGFLTAYGTVLLNQRCVCPDGTGTLDILKKLSVSPEGARELQRAEFWARMAPVTFFQIPVTTLVIESIGSTSEWESEELRYISSITYATAWSFGLAQLYAGTGANLACCAIVRDQLRQTTRRLEELISSSIASQTEPAFDFRATMAEMYRLTQHQVQCERIGASILVNAVGFQLTCGALFTYALATGDPEHVVLNAIFGICAVVFFAQCIDMLLGPMSVTAGAHEHPATLAPRLESLMLHATEWNCRVDASIQRGKWAQICPSSGAQRRGRHDGGCAGQAKRRSRPGLHTSWSCGAAIDGVDSRGRHG